MYYAHLCRLPKTYPNKIPELQLVNPKGLPPPILRQLDDSLKKAAKDMVGREMMYDLADHVRTFLANHNAPPPEGSKLSFHEQMVKRMEHDLQVAIQDRVCMM